MGCNMGCDKSVLIDMRTDVRVAPCEYDDTELREWVDSEIDTLRSEIPHITYDDTPKQGSLNPVTSEGIASYVSENTAKATADTLGTIKLNPDESIDADADGHLKVGGRLGQYPDGGVYYPTDIAPSGVGSSSLLISDGAKGLKLSKRSFAIMSGSNITCKSAVAGSTQYRVENNYQNRFKCYAVKGGRAALTQEDAQKNGTAIITSIKFANGEDIRVYFGNEEPNNDIIITLDGTVNPNTETTSIRCYGTNEGVDNILAGQAVGASRDRLISLGMFTYAGGLQTVAIGNSVVVLANTSVGMGHSMLVNRHFSFGVGQGHDFTRAANGTSALGMWSQINAKTKLAIGNGTADNARSNILEITDDGGQTGIVMKSPNGTKYKITVDDDGTLLTSKA